MHILFKRKVIRLITCVVSDLDGTLLHDDFGCSKRTIRAIKSLIAQGIAFIPATGRPYADVVELFHQHGISCKSIVLNGAQARDEQGSIIEASNLSMEAVYQIVQILQHHNCSIQLFCSDTLYAYKNAKQVRKDMSAVISRNIGTPYQADLLQELQKDEIELQTILKIETMSLDNDRLQACQSELQSLSDIQCVSSIPGNLEIVNQACSKGTMLRNLMKYLPFQEDELLIFGDSLNDASLFEQFPNTVAVRNAHPEIKQKAKYICLSNNEDGVARRLEEIICR